MGTSIFRIAALSIGLFALAACGGGGGSGGSGGGGGGGSSYTIGGAVSGLSGSGLVLQNSGGNNLGVTANGNFTFTTSVTSGGNYSVSISAQPSGQTCAVSSGSGTVSNAAVTSVSVACRALVGKFLYVPNTGSNDLSVFSINVNTGALTALGSGPVAAGQAPQFGAVDPTEKFLYVSNQGSVSAPPSISAYVINGTTGALTANANSPFPLSVAVPPPNGAAVINPAIFHPSGKFGYVSNRTDQKLYGATIDAGTGDLTEIAGMPITLGPILGFGTYDSTAKYFYLPHNLTVGGLLTGYVSAFQVDSSSGVPTLIGPPVPTGGSVPISVQRDPSGKFLFASNQAGVGGAGNGSVAVFSIDASSGALTAVPGSPFGVSGGPAISVTVHPTRNLAYVVVSPAGSNGTLATFQMDAATGALSPIAAAPATIGVGSGFAVIEPTGKFLIINNRDSNNIQSFSIDQTTGALTQVAGSPLATEQKPTPLRPDPSWKYFYSANNGSSTMSSYALNATTGAITLVNTVPAGTSPFFPVLVGRQ